MKLKSVNLTNSLKHGLAILVARKSSRSLSSASTTSSAAKISALVEAAAARENAKYERIIVAKEHACKEREAELKRDRK